MARVRDIWHQRQGLPCGEHGKPPSNRHGTGRRWLVVWTDPLTRKEQSAAYSRKPDADRHATDVGADVQRGEYIDPRAGNVTFETIGREWLSHRMVAPTTYDRDRQTLQMLSRTFGAVPIADITPSRVRAWLKGRSRQVAPRTVNLELWQLGAILDTAVDDDRIRRNPCAKVDRLKVPPKDFEPWPIATIAQIIGAHSGRYRIIPAVAFGAGLRLGEALGLAVDDIDWLRRQVHVRRQLTRINGKNYVKPPKRGSIGTVQLEPETIDLLAAILASHPPTTVTLPWITDDTDLADPAHEPQLVTLDLLVVGPRGAPFTRPSYSQGHWYPALASAGLIPAPTRHPTSGKAIYETVRRFGPHHLRHDYASYRLYEGEPMISVQRRLRHKRLDELQTYAHVISDAEVTRIPEAVASVFRICSGSVPVGSRSARVPEP